MKGTGPVAGETPPLFARRATEAVAVGDDLYLFGGVGADGTESVLDVTDDFYRFDTTDYNWEQVPAKNQGPSARRCQGWDATGSHIYFWGGSGVHPIRPDENYPNQKIIAPDDAEVTYDFRNDLWRYDLQTSTWSQLESADYDWEKPPEDRPRPRYTAAFHAFDEQYIVFSGKTEDQSSSTLLLNDLWLRDSKGEWREISPTEGEDWPSKRYGCMSALHDRKMYICGGFGEHDLNDLWVFNIDERQWVQLSSHDESSSKPVPRYGSSFIYYDNSLYLFGGRSREYPKRNYNDLWKFDLETQQWIEIHGNRTPHRYGPDAEFPAYHAKSANARVDEQWYIWGGEGRHGHVSDFWRYDLDAREWTMIQPARDDDPEFW